MATHGHVASAYRRRSAGSARHATAAAHEPSLDSGPSARNRPTTSPTSGQPTRIETSAPQQVDDVDHRARRRSSPTRRPVRQAQTTPMPTPSRPENAWVTGVRWTSRTTTATHGRAATAATSAGVELAGRRRGRRRRTAGPGRRTRRPRARRRRRRRRRTRSAVSARMPAQAALLGRDDVVDRVAARRCGRRLPLTHRDAAAARSAG